MKGERRSREIERTGEETGEQSKQNPQAAAEYQQQQQHQPAAAAVVTESSSQQTARGPRSGNNGQCSEKEASASNGRTRPAEGRRPRAELAGPRRILLGASIKGGGR